ncbi:MAG: hypothetical protein AAGB51_00240 [Planctomycetota bacterium]
MKDSIAPPPDRTRNLGLVAAAALAVVILAGLGLVVLFGPSPSPTSAEPSLAPEDEIQTVGAISAESGSGGQIEVTAEDDPSKTEAILRYDSLDPAGGGRYAMENPAAWIYLDNDQRAHVSAARGTILLGGQDRSRPDSGNLAGGVEILYFGPGNEPDLIDPNRDDADLIAETPSLAFDLLSGEISTNQRLVVTSESMDFEGTGVVALFGEVRQRLERLTVRTDGKLTYRPTSSDTGTTDNPTSDVAASPAASSPSTTSARAPAPQPVIATRAPVETRYLAEFNDGVRITQVDRFATADKLEVWLRLIDGALPERTSLSRNAAPESLPAMLAAAAISQVGVTGAAPANDAPVELTWTGELLIRPIADAPAPPPQQLVSDDLFVRLTAERAGRVHIVEPDEAIQARAPMAAMGLTTRDIVMTGPGAAAVTIEAEGRGRMTVGRIEANTTTGIAAVPGPGRLEGLNAGGRGSEVRWNERADFVFEAANGKTRPVLQQALFTGDVEASDGPNGRIASISAGFLRTDFDENPDSPDKPLLTRLIAREDVVATDGRGGELKATDVLSVSFGPPLPDSDVAEPKWVTASGGVFASMDGEWISSERLDAELVRDDTGRTTVSDLTAEGSVELRARDDVVAMGEVLRAQPLEQLAHLMGDGAFVSRGPTRISSSSIDLDGNARIVRTDAAGLFNHTPPTGTTVDAEWTRGMLFDDRAGLLEAEGAVVAAAESTNSQGSRAWDELRADRIRVRLEGNPEAPAVSAQNEEGTGGEARRVLGIHAWAASTDPSDGAEPVKVESRRYAPNRPGVLARLTYLEGHEVIADEVYGTLRVPDAGRLVVRDRLDPDGVQADADDQQRGDTLFNWQGSMELDRTAGTAVLTRQVELIHRRLGDGAITQLECERLVAGVGREDAEPGRPGALGRLRSALAEEAVWLQSGEGAESKEMISDTLRYDAQLGTVRAESLEGGWVTLIDGRRPTPVTARSIDWDLNTDRIELDDAGPAVAPR